MTEGIRFLCMLEVMNEFAELISEEAYDKFSYGEQSVVLDVSDYTSYCIRLLSNNGLSKTRDMGEMKKFMQDVLFLILEQTGNHVSGMKWVDSDTVELIR